jgi:tRNA(His) 5'-end guanylyltransferase
VLSVPIATTLPGLLPPRAAAGDECAPAPARAPRAADRTSPARTAGQTEAAQRAREWFHGLTIPAGMWVVLRADGRGFSRLTQDRYAKPFDERMRDHMVAAAAAWMTDFGAVYGATHSDEISVALPPGTELFGRVLEKLVSVSAGLCSAAFTAAAGFPAHFDARAWIGATPGEVADYFAWRQSDGRRCALATCCYWALRQAGSTSRQATSQLTRAPSAQQNELLARHGISFTALPAWQRRGVGLSWEDYVKTGTGPRTGTQVPVLRRRLRADDQVPAGEEYRAVIAAALAAGQP